MSKYETALMDKLDRGEQLTDDEVRHLMRPDRFLLTFSRSEMDGIPGVTFYAVGRGVREWARFNQTIAGSRWEYMGDNVAYAMCDDSAHTFLEAKKEGYRVRHS